MKELMKRVCLTLMVALLGVTTLIKADSVDGASIKTIYKGNMINVHIKDQYGNKITAGKLTLYDATGKALTSLDLSTGSLTHITGKYLIRIGANFYAYPEHFQKYVTEGTVKGVNMPTKKYPSDSFWVKQDPSEVRVWYDPNRTDHTLAANSIGVYIDPKWKNTPQVSLYVASTVFRFTEKTGMYTVSTAAGEYSGTIIQSNRGGSISGVKSSETETKYVKRKIKLSELNSKDYGADGSFLITDRTVKVATGDPEDCAIYTFVSGGMITIPVPDSQGYVEVYVEKSTGDLTDFKDYFQDGGSGGGSNDYCGYPYIDMNIQGIAAPSEGYGMMGLEAGKYLIGIEMGGNYTTYVSPVLEVKNSEDIQEINLTVHKHNYSANWKTDGTNHWKDCACGTKANVAAHTYGSWVIDKAATEDATGLKHRNCTVCNYKQTETIAKLTHTHKPSTTWSKDTCNHWKTCSCGSKLNNAVHSYKWVIDKESTTETAGLKHQECTTCGYKKDAVEIPKLHKHSYGDWKNNGEGHWHECSCGNKQDYAVHSSTKEATETTAKTCDTCGYIMTPATGHINHIADGSKYYYDENTHWYQCVGCTIKMEEHDHSFQWIVDWEATEDMAGQKHEECIDCGYKKEAVEIPRIIIEIEPATEAPTEEVTEQDTTVASTELNSKSAGFNWIWLIIGSVVIVGIIIILVIILAKKKKNKDK